MSKKFELSGVYRITNKNNGKFYIGSSRSIFSRWFNHTCDLKNNNHTNYKLQRAFNKYGMKSFTFEVVELHEPEGLNKREQYYLDTLCRAQEYIKGTSSFFNQGTYNIKPLVEGLVGLPKRYESIIKANRSRGIGRIFKVSAINGSLIKVYELSIEAAEDNTITRHVVSRSISKKACPKNKDYYFCYENEYDPTFNPSTFKVHNKGVKNIVTIETNWKEVFCYDIYGRFYKKFASNMAVANYFKVDTSCTSRMVDKPKKKVLHRVGIHLYNLYSEEVLVDTPILNLFSIYEDDGNIEVYTLLHEYLGSYCYNTISKILDCHNNSVSQAVTQEKILKGFYFIRD